MKRVKLYIVLIVLCQFLTSLNTVLGQSNWEIGLAPLYELQEGNFRFGGGIQVDRKLSKKYSIETGIYYRSLISEYIIIYQPAPFSSLNVKVRENYIWTPLLVKRQGKIANLSGGFTIQKYIGFNNIGKSSNAQITKYEVNPEWLWGIMAKLGHTILICEKISLEPEISANYQIEEQVFVYNIGISAKCKF